MEIVHGELSEIGVIDGWQDPVSGTMTLCTGQTSPLISMFNVYQDLTQYHQPLHRNQSVHTQLTLLCICDQPYTRRRLRLE